MSREMVVTYPQLLRIPPTRMREQNGGGELHVASTTETFATIRAIPIGDSKEGFEERRRR
jgi:hypothetical protein